MYYRNGGWGPDLINLKEEYSDLLNMIESGDLSAINDRFKIDAKSIDDAETFRGKFEALIGTLEEADVDVTKMKRSLFEGWALPDLFKDPLELGGYFKNLSLDDDIFDNFINKIALYEETVKKNKNVEDGVIPDQRKVRESADAIDELH